MQVEEFISRLSQELQKELPGLDAQKIMAPSIRYSAMENADPSKAKDCSVLLLLYPKEEQLTISFIKRTPDNNNIHGGQISLPGGKYEEYDSSLIKTALRETNEELGINVDDAKILGTLTQLYIPISSFNVLPVIGYINKTPKFIPNPFEVEEVIEIPLIELFHPKNKEEHQIQKDGHKIQAPYFNAYNHKIWGATAMIISELHSILIKSGLLIPNRCKNDL